MQKIKVPQDKGDISISKAGGAPNVYPVKNGSVDVEDSDVDGFLRQIPGSEVSAGKADGGNPTKEA